MTSGGKKILPMLPFETRESPELHSDLQNVIPSEPEQVSPVLLPEQTELSLPLQPATPPTSCADPNLSVNQPTSASAQDTFHTGAYSSVLSSSEDFDLNLIHM